MKSFPALVLTGLIFVILLLIPHVSPAEVPPIQGITKLPFTVKAVNRGNASNPTVVPSGGSRPTNAPAPQSTVATPPLR